MTFDWYDQFTRQAFDEVDAFIAQNPGCTRQDIEQPAQSATNRVAFARRGRDPIALKVYCTPDHFKNELFCLRHFAGTGVVPEIHHVVPERIIVMTRLAGTDLSKDIRQSGYSEAELRELSRSLGVAAGKLANAGVPEPGEGYSAVRDFAVIHWPPRLEDALDLYLECARGIHQRSEMYAAPFFGRTLELIDDTRATVLEARRVLYHDDFGNTCSHAGRMTGFFDLEGCRVGTKHLQLSTALQVCIGDERCDWHALLAGYEEESGQRLDDRDLLAVLAMSYFHAWVRISCWGSWDGSASRESLPDWFLAAEPVGREYMSSVHLVLSHIPAISRWLDQGGML